MSFDYRDLKISIETSETIDADHINDGSDRVEDFINRGISRLELSEKIDNPKLGMPANAHEFEGWLSADKIYKPEFYGSPSPRMMAVSGQTHFRELPDSWSDSELFHAELVGSNPVSIPNTATTIKLRQPAVVNIMCSFYCFEWGGVNEERNQTQSAIRQQRFGYEARSAGNVFLSVSGDIEQSTQRKIFTSNVGPIGHTFNVATDELHDHIVANGFMFLPMIGRHQHFMFCQRQLKEGVHDIGLVFEPHRQTEKNYRMQIRYADTDNRYGLPESDIPHFPYRKHIIFKARNLIVDAYYKRTNDVPSSYST